MYYVYVIKSQKSSGKFYVGYTLDLAERMKTHNSGVLFILLSISHGN